jgi:hypothetical protein
MFRAFLVLALKITMVIASAMGAFELNTSLGVAVICFFICQVLDPKDH